jgi:dephospho-CoA kinase
MIIGITGTDGAGKGTVVNYLVTKGFTHYEALRLFVEEIKRQGLESNRANMRIVANELRAIHGDSFLVDTYLKRMKEEGRENVIIESIRALSEVAALKSAGCILFAVDADQKLRYERIEARASDSDRVTFEEFRDHEALEMNDPDPHGMQKAAVIAAADYTIVNDTDLSALRAQIDIVLAKIKEVTP